MKNFKSISLVVFPITLVIAIILGCGGSPTTYSSNGYDYEYNPSTDTLTVSVQQPEPVVEEFPFEEDVLYSDEALNIKLTSYVETDGMPEISMTIVNSSDEDYSIEKFNSTINGIMQCGGTDETSILAGKTLTAKIKFRDTEFKRVDISTIYNVGIKIFLKSEASSEKIETEYKTFEIREGSYTLNDELVYEDDKFDVYKVSASDDLKKVKIRIHNKCSTDVAAIIKDSSVNDNMCDCLYFFSSGRGLWHFSNSGDVLPGCDMIADLEFDSDKLTEKGISEINEIEFMIKDVESNSVTDIIKISK